MDGGWLMLSAGCNMMDDRRWTGYDACRMASDGLCITDYGMQLMCY